MQRLVPAPERRSALIERHDSLAGKVRVKSAGLHSKATAMAPPHRPLEGNRRLRDIEMQRLSGGSAGVAKYQIVPGSFFGNQAIEILPDIFFGEDRQLGEVFAASECRRATASDSSSARDNTERSRRRDG